MNLQDLIDFLEDESNRLEKELLLELAADLSKLEDAFSNQSEPIALHVMELQLYGYESSAIQTIYDIYANLLSLHRKKANRKYLANIDKLYNWFEPFENQEEYDLFYRRKKRTLDDKFAYKPNLGNLDYNKVNEVYEHIASLVSKNFYYSDRSYFYSDIRKILGI